MHQLKRNLPALLLIFLFSAGCDANHPQTPPMDLASSTPVGSQSSALYYKSSGIWPTNDAGFAVIPVCWKNAGHLSEKANVETVMTGDTSWSEYGSIVFDFSSDPNNACKTNNNGIRIHTSVDEMASYTGRTWPSNTVDMWLQLETDPVGWGPCETNDLDGEECLRMAARHEFGHALSIYHEQDRHDRTCARAVTVRSYATTVGDYDENSIMNYCSGAVELSQGDKEGIAVIYPWPTLEINITPDKWFQDETTWSLTRTDSDGNISAVSELTRDEKKRRLDTLRRIQPPLSPAEIQGVLEVSFGKSVDLKKEGFYTFSIKDSYGDGLCSSYSGCGNYEIVFNNGKQERVLTQGDKFEKEEIFEFWFNKRHGLDSCADTSVVDGFNGNPTTTGCDAARWHPKNNSGPARDYCQGQGLDHLPRVAQWFQRCCTWEQDENSCNPK